MSEFLFKKKVDQSILRYGFTVAKEYEEVIQTKLNAHPEKGSSILIQIIIGGQQYAARLSSVNYNDENEERMTLQIRYSDGSDICKRLNDIFSTTAKRINALKDNGEKVKLGEEESEYIDVCASDDGRLEFVCHPKEMDMLTSFKEYIGPVNSFSGYQCSYKLVFYKVFFERRVLKKNQDLEAFSEDFLKFYQKRYTDGNTTDVGVVDIIANPMETTSRQALDLIKRNPYSVVHEKGFFKIENENFVLTEQLDTLITDEEAKKILEFVNKKIDNYYAMKVDMNSELLKPIIERFMNGYLEASNEIFAGNEFGTFVRNEMPDKIYKTGIVSDKVYKVTGSIGQGNWAAVPWIGIFDKKITTSATKGVYIVYLLSKDTNSLYLTFNQGCTEIRATHSKNETISIMRNKASEIASSIDARGFNTDELIHLGDNISELAEMYQRGTIFYKEYKKGMVPNEDELQSDLRKMVDIYGEYVDQLENANGEDEWLPSLDEYQPGITKEKWLELLRNDQVFNEKCLIAMACLYDNGGQGSCSELEEKYRYPMTLWRTSCGVHLANRIAEYTHCRINKSNGKEECFTIPFLYRRTKKGELGSYIYKLRPELEEALKEFGIGKYLIMGEGEVQLDNKNTLRQIEEYISAKGFTFDDGLIENYYLSLKSKPFVILAGTSGTGKTRLVRLFAEAIGATVENGRYKLVSVRPDWSDSSDLFGHVDLNGTFVPGEIIDFVKDASEHKELPYFLCLDEMNLARVEYYLSDILSVIETREMIDGEVVTDPLISENYYGTDINAQNRYGQISIPENLYIIGTVNMDETTFPFSRKVLDRANTIEFSTVDFSSGLSDDLVRDEIAPLELDNSFMKANYVLLKQCADSSAHLTLVNQVCAELQKINNELEKANAHVGYRVRDEISFYMLNNQDASLLTNDQALDNEIMQKILPRIQGSSVSIKNMLCELFRICAGDYEGYQTESDNVSSRMFAKIKNKDSKYKRSAEKIAYMVRRFEEDGFTAYWL